MPPGEMPSLNTAKNRVTPSRKHNGSNVFPTTDTRRVFKVPSLLLQRNRITFQHVSVV